MLRAFLAWFNSQSLDTRRAIVRERALAYADHPLVIDLIAACPIDIADAAEQLRAAVKRSDWRA